MSVMLAAADLGIGTCHSAVGDQDLARAVLGLPANREVRGNALTRIPAGRPLAPVEQLDRRAFDDVVHRGGWWFACRCRTGSRRSAS